VVEGTLSQMSNYADGEIFISRSPISSLHFVGITLTSLAALLFAAYLALTYHRFVTANFIVALCCYVGLQSFYQWWRCVKTLNRVRQLYESVPEYERTQGSRMNLALRVAVSGLVDLLFWGSGVTICSLALIWTLLRHLSGSH
jgi:hypothetical protein